MSTQSTREPGPDEGTAKAGEERRVEVRAEEIVERVSAGVARFARRTLMRAREEAEDIVAEAQTLRRGERRP
jgi:hypothetical protein